MSALATSFSSPQVIPPPSDDIFVFDNELRRAAKQYRSAAMRIAFYAWRLRYALGEDWSRLGVASEDAYREQLGISQSSFYRYLRIGQALHQLPLAELEQITISNAELLMQVDPILWTDFDWVKEAKLLSSEELCKRIIQRNRQHGSDREPQTYYRCKVPFTAKKFLEETVEKFRLENNLASAGEALELLIADVHDRPNVMTAVKRAHDYVHWAMFRLRKRRKESTEMQWLHRSKLLLYKAYWATRMDEPGDVHAENKKAVYPTEDLQESQDFAEWNREVFEQPIGPRGEEAKTDVAVEPPEWYLRIGNLPTEDVSDRSDDDFEGDEG